MKLLTRNKHAIPASREFPAYTVIELIVVIVVSSIVFMSAYTAFFHFSRLFSGSDRYMHTMQQYVVLYTNLERDIKQAGYVETLTNGITCINTASKVNTQYHFDASHIIRMQKGETDTFTIPVLRTGYGFLENGSWVDSLSLTTGFFGEEFTLVCLKQYSNQQLFWFDTRDEKLE